VKLLAIVALTLFLTALAAANAPINGGLRDILIAVALWAAIVVTIVTASLAMLVV